jgi:hypothetical protein
MRLSLSNNACDEQATGSDVSKQQFLASQRRIHL